MEPKCCNSNSFAPFVAHDVFLFYPIASSGETNKGVQKDVTHLRCFVKIVYPLAIFADITKVKGTVPYTCTQESQIRMGRTLILPSGYEKCEEMYICEGLAALF
jgi:hypothetical protein